MNLPPKSGSFVYFSLLLSILIVWFFAPLAAFGADTRGRYHSMNVSAASTTEDIQALVDLIHPNSIRLTLNNAAADTQTLSEYMTWLEASLDHIDANLLPLLEQNSIKVILSMQTPPGGFAVRFTGKSKMRVFAELEFQNTLISIWESLATRYAANNNVVAYHLLNEPAIGTGVTGGVLTWPQLQNQLIAKIRAIDTVKAIIVTPEYSKPNSIHKVSVPKSGAPYWYGLTMYYPTVFLRQGVEYKPYKTKYPSKKANKAMVVKYLKRAIDFGKKKKAQIWVTEFTTSRFAPSGSGPKYLRDMISLFKSNKWNWTYHAWREAHPWNVELPALEDKDSSVPTKRAEILKRFTK